MSKNRLEVEELDLTPEDSEDDHIYPIEALGLSTPECELILAAMNGYTPPMKGPLTDQYLADELFEAASQSKKDHEAFGHDLSFPPGDSPEMPATLRRLAEKVSTLEGWQQSAITFFAAGFWAGIGAAAGQAAEIAE